MRIFRERLGSSKKDVAFIQCLEHLKAKNCIIFSFLTYASSATRWMSVNTKLLATRNIEGYWYILPIHQVARKYTI